MKVSVIVVSYNTKEHLRLCLTSLPDDLEVIVIDNASTDGSPDMVASIFPHLHLIRNELNVGFGAANNQGLDVMSGDLALFLNSDARPMDGAIAELASVFDDPSIVFAGGRLEFPDGELQESACRELNLWAVFCEQTYLEKVFPKGSWLSPYWISSMLLKQGDWPHNVAQVMGSCLIIRPIERFNEAFFLYCEDTELCKRLQSHGKGVYVPKARFIHALGASSEGARWKSVARYNRGKELYFALHHSRFQMVFCWILNRLGALLRLIVWSLESVCTLFLVRKIRQKALIFLLVLTAPVKGPRLPRDSFAEPRSDPQSS